MEEEEEGNVIIWKTECICKTRLEGGIINTDQEPGVAFPNNNKEVRSGACIHFLGCYNKSATNLKQETFIFS